MDVPLYKWFARISFAFTLEAFVFLSGYLFEFQKITLNRKSRLGNLIISKLRRLILPSIVFSIAYFLIFFKYSGFWSSVYCIINGCGHMWFLPMLFWCFIGGWLLDRIHIGDNWKIFILVCISLFSFFSLPLRIDSAASYLLFFYLGEVFYKHTDTIRKRISIESILVCWAIFIVFFFLLRPLQDVLVVNDRNTILQKLLIYSGNKACRLVYSWFGLLALYCSAVCFTEDNQLAEIIHMLSVCCFGIYLFQQFVLKVLYYKTDIPSLAGPYLLPWCGFIIALSVSFALTVFIRKTEIGREFI